ncbi:MAG: EAL domain-containing protein [Sphingomonas phyllosphaerae]
MMEVGWQNMVRAMARTFGPGLSVRHANATPIRLTLRICNYAHIAHAYGEDVAEDVVAELSRRLGLALPSSARIAQRPNGILLATLGDDLELADDVIAALILAWFPTFCSAVMGSPVETRAGRLCVWLSGDWDVSTCQNGRLFAFGGHPVEDSIEAAAHYRADMELAADLMPLLLPDATVKMKDGRGLFLYWQPIVDSGPGSTLYYESLLRPCGRDGAFQSSETLMRALERLGFACLLDRYVASAVLDELEATPDVTLAINVSAQSLACDHWWGEIDARLRRRPDVARRLVWEITETTHVFDLAPAVALIETFKSRGCKVALDDFGVGFASIQQLRLFSPDIIKIDKLYLGRAMETQQDGTIFRRIVGLARSFGAEVVVEGVETPMQAELVRTTEANWQQGFLVGVPSAERPWRLPDSAVVLRLQGA